MQYEGRTVRHELKYYINLSVYHSIRNRLKIILNPDENMKEEDGYIISSLYFDDIYGSAFREKKSGIQFRKKFRIRSYDNKDDFIRLECKHKYGEFISKTSATLTREEYDRVLDGDYLVLANRKEEVCKQLIAYNRTRLLRPKVIVEYLREAYTLPQGNIRITFDKFISSSVGTLDMFSEDYITKKILQDDIMVMEVKFDEFIPTYVLSIIETAMADRCAISKYVMCMEELRRITLK